MKYPSIKCFCVNMKIFQKHTKTSIDGPVTIIHNFGKRCGNLQRLFIHKIMNRYETKIILSKIYSKILRKILVKLHT